MVAAARSMPQTPAICLRTKSRPREEVTDKEREAEVSNLVPQLLAWRSLPEAAGEANRPDDFWKRCQLQRLSQQRLRHCVKRCLEGGNVVEPRQSLVTLLKGRDPYDVSGSGAIAPCDCAPVSLPESVHRAQLLADHLPVAERSLLEGFKEEICRSSSEEASLADLHGIPGCHTLDASQPPREYARLVRWCVDIGVTGFALKGRGHVGIFFVGNENGASRMVIDRRRVNIKLETPPHCCVVDG